MNPFNDAAQVAVRPIEIITRIDPINPEPIRARNGDPWFTPRYGHFVGMIDKGVLWFDVTASVEEKRHVWSQEGHVYRSMSAKTATDLPAWVVAGARQVAQSLGVRLPFDGDDQ